MPRRKPLLRHQFESGGDQALTNETAIGFGRDQKSWAGCRCMRQAAQQFGKVGLAELIVGGCPRPVVDEVAMRVETNVERQDAAHHAIFVGRGQVPREPAARSPRCTVGFQHSQKITIEERMARRTKPRPRLMRNGLGGVVAGDGELWH